MSCRYQGPLTLPRLYSALAALVADEPMLRVGIKNQHVDTAHFTHVDKVDLSVQVKTIEADYASQAEYDALVSKQQGLCHDALWENIETVAPWRITLIKPKGQDFQDLIYSYHHSLMDGTSGKLFHERLIVRVNEVKGEGLEKPILEFPKPPTVPDPMEARVPFEISKWYLTKMLWNEFGPSFLKQKPPQSWSSSLVDFKLPYVTRLRAIDINGKTLKAVLAACREHSTTFTGLLHALVLASLAKRVDSTVLSCLTPISLRPFATAPPEKLAVCLTQFSLLFPEDTIKAMKETQSDENIWKAATYTRNKLTERMKEIPKDDIMGLLKFVSDWQEWFKKKDGKPRDSSWEVSNIGVVEAGEGDVRLTRTMFTNGATVAGAGVSFNVASVKGEGLTIGVVWQEGGFDEEMVDDIVGDLKEWFTKYNA